MGEDKYQTADEQTEQTGCSHGTSNSFADSFFLVGTIVLSNKCGKGVTKILYRHIGKGVNFYCSSKSGHYRGSKAVDKSLDHQNSKVHNGLLKTGQY